MRPSRTVAGAAIALLALGALPGLVGSREPKQATPIDAVAFRDVDLATASERQSVGAVGLDATGRSAGALGRGTPIREPVGTLSHGTPSQPNPARPSWTWNVPRTTIRGIRLVL